MEHHYNPVDQPVETIEIIEGLKVPLVEEAVEFKWLAIYTEK